MKSRWTPLFQETPVTRGSEERETDRERRALERLFCETSQRPDEPPSPLLSVFLFFLSIITFLWLAE